MTRHMIWAEDEKFTGWCCSQCLWGMVAPRLESTVAALAFNREAQTSFDGHACARHSPQETITSRPHVELPLFQRSRMVGHNGQSEEAVDNFFHGS